MQIIQICKKKDMKAFVHFPNALYKGNEFYVPQMESMDLDTFNPSVNKAFEVCEGAFYLAVSDDGRVLGRVAAIVNHKYNSKVGRKICRFGWIDFVDDPAVCKALLDRVEAYARSKGMEEVEGPVGFLEFDITGVLVEGFDQLPTAYGKYNAPYYEKYILDCGYAPYTDYVEYRITLPEVMPDRYERFASVVAERNGLVQVPIRSKKDIAPYIRSVFECMNRCYSHLEGFSELTDGQCDDLVKQFLPNLHPDFVSIITPKDSARVVAFGVAMPSLSKALQRSGGRMLPWGWFHLLKALKKNDTLDALLIAIDDRYKDKGVNAMVFDKFIHSSQKHGIKYVESTRELADNTQVQNLWGRFEHRLHKRARTYIKSL